MKTPLLLATLLGFCAHSFAAPLDPPANHPLGVADVVWGSSPADAKKAMLARTGVKLVSETPDKIVFSGGYYADLPAESWEMMFTGGKFTEGFIKLTPADVLSHYESIRKQITAKYKKAGREEKESAEHRATYWAYSLTTGQWGIVCDVRIPHTLTIRYKDKSPAKPSRTGGADDL